MIKLVVSGLFEDKDEINAILDLVKPYHPELIKVEAYKSPKSDYYVGRLNPPRWAKKAKKRTTGTGRSLDFRG